MPDRARSGKATEAFAQLGDYEAAFYVLPESLDMADFNAALLAELDADCLAGVAHDTLTTVHTTADDLGGDLFTAAAGGGLAGEAQHGAYGRLLTWRSLYALMALDADVSHHDAVRLATDHRWLRFAVSRDTPNQWFQHGLRVPGPGPHTDRVGGGHRDGLRTQARRRQGHSPRKARAPGAAGMDRPRRGRGDETVGPRSSFFQI